jgi:hypothetical protein
MKIIELIAAKMNQQLNQVSLLSLLVLVIVIILRKPGL